MKISKFEETLRIVLLEVLGLQTGLLSYSLKSYGAKFYIVMPSPRVIRKPGALQLYVGGCLSLFWYPSDSKESFVHAVCFTAAPRAHEK